VATGVVEPKFAAYLGKGQEDRERGDYEPYNPFSRTEAEEFLNKAEAFVAKVKELIESQKQE
ncbi:MAG: HEPN domain-containing protein, partial [Chloroflexota bacterium]